MPNKSSLSRRKFLKTVAGASAFAAAPYFVPASALGKGGAVPPSERIVVGGTADTGLYMTQFSG